MANKCLQDILSFVEQPSRYLGTEINRIRKNHASVRLKTVLAFPDVYEIGTSHFGIQILYALLNAQEEIVAERVYAPAADMETFLRTAGIPLASMETQTPIHDFDIIGFSLLYELNYTNVLTILDLAAIPFRSDQRDASHPIVIAGGPCTCNPEPVADLFDAMVIGDGEAVVLEMARTWLEWDSAGDRDKETLLRAWSRIEGVYVPSFFEPEYTPEGFQRVLPRFPDYTTVSRAVVPDLDTAPFPETPIVPYGKPIHDRLRLEVARGCSRGCRFCQAGMIYRPVRERSPATLIRQADAAVAATGYENISLLSLSTGDYSCLSLLMETLISRCETDKIAVSLPSLRAETLTPELMDLIRRIRKTGFTIAPEAGSHRLRTAINKNINDSDIYNAIDGAFALGWRVIKLYFMVGLPTETLEDLEAMVNLVKDLRKRHRRAGRLNVSVATFIPKPHTPFQWAPQNTLVESKDKIDWLRDRLKLPGIHFKWQSPEMSILEGLWARGDRRLTDLLVTAYEKGCRFDGWGDQFRFQSWQQALSDTHIPMDFYTTRTRDPDEPLPWDHIDTKVSKAFLQDEWRKSFLGQPTPDCRKGVCSACGVCETSGLTPIVHSNCRHRPQAHHKGKDASPAVYRRLKVSYAKTKQAKYFGHLELKNIFFRALRRADIPIRFTEGFHPMPKASFEDPLPIGMESEREAFYIAVAEGMASKTVQDRLSEHLPEGLTIRACRFTDKKPLSKKPISVRYRVILKDRLFDRNALDTFNKRDTWHIVRRKKTGETRTIDLKERVLDIQLSSPMVLEILLKSDAGNTIRPAEVISHLFDLPDTALKQARVIKCG